jgi:pimeloyl-ACP methyl ester carboxylesterase
MKPIRLTLTRLIGALLALAVVAYLGAIIWLVANETRLVFRPDAPLDARRPAMPFQQIDDHLAAAGGQPESRAWVMPAATPDAGAWVIFLHGNDSNLASRMNVLHYERLRALGVNVLAPEYRGFGGLGGVPTEGGLADDATHWYGYLRRQKNVDPGRIVIYGWSLGSAVAVTLASRVPEAAVILEGAPASIVAIGQQRYPIFPVRLLIHNPFESIQRVGSIQAPMLFLHSPEDVVVPIAEGRRLFTAAATSKQFVEVSGGHVYASEKDPRFFPTIQSFLRAQHLLP